MNKRPSAHGARLNGGKHHTATQAMIAQPGSSLAQRHDLGMGRRIVIQQIAIVPAANNLSISDYQSATTGTSPA